MKSIWSGVYINLALMSVWLMVGMPDLAALSAAFAAACALMAVVGARP